MYKNCIEKLEFNKILEILEDLCITDIGKNFASTLRPR